MFRSPRAEIGRWAASLALMLPAAIPYAVHFADQRPYSRPTGYIQGDMPLYMAKAREAFDAGQFGVLYGNPCDGLSGEPRVYFQPWTFALGWVHWMTGVRPGVLWVGFWFLAALVAARVFVAIYEDFVGLDGRAKRLGLVAFFWGGGVLALAGIVRGVIVHGSVDRLDLTAFDPFLGWWFLNLGRNLVYPTEALYHALAFGSLLCVARALALRSCGAPLGLALAMVTVACSPFAGLELLAILWLGLLVECLVRFNRATALLFAGANGLAIAFFAYYLGYLNRFPEHRVIASQMALPWRYGWVTPLFAYGVVFSLAAWRFRSIDRAATLLRDPRNRLLIAWTIAALALENHDLVIAPRQPIHFTRGYAWAALFLLGAPTLTSLFDRLRRPARLALLGLLLLDNAAWFAGFAFDYRIPDRNGVRLSGDQVEVLRRLDEDDLLGRVLLSEDERLSYVALAETRLRSWLGHPLETPDYRRRGEEVEALFSRGEFAPPWRSLPLVVVRYREDGELGPPDWTLRRGGRLMFANRRFQILQFAPGEVSATSSQTGGSGDRAD